MSAEKQNLNVLVVKTDESNPYTNLIFPYLDKGDEFDIRQLGAMTKELKIGEKDCVLTLIMHDAALLPNQLDHNLTNANIVICACSYNDVTKNNLQLLGNKITKKDDHDFQLSVFVLDPESQYDGKDLGLGSISCAVISGVVTPQIAQDFINNRAEDFVTGRKEAHSNFIKTSQNMLMAHMRKDCIVSILPKDVLKMILARTGETPTQQLAFNGIMNGSTDCIPVITKHYGHAAMVMQQKEPKTDAGKGLL